MDIEVLANWIETSERIVFFGGAGVSTESGIPDFRSSRGLYHQDHHISPEIILSHQFFYSRTREFYKFYIENMIFESAKPNITHRFLAQLEADGKLSAIVTQNIDGLHQLAGSKNVYEMHGSIYRNHCTACCKQYDMAVVKDYTKFRDGIPRCSCGGVIKPNVVLYGEPLDDETVSNSIKVVENADLLIVGGTSLSVYPAAGLVDYYRGKRIALVNKDRTKYDRQMALVIHDQLGHVFSELQHIIYKC